MEPPARFVRIYQTAYGRDHLSRDAWHRTVRVERDGPMVVSIVLVASGLVVATEIIIS